MKKLLTLIRVLTLTAALAQAPQLSRADEPDNETALRVTGSLSPLGLERLGRPISILTHEKLQERTESSIGDLLSSQPGVASTSFGPGASRPVIRGQSRERVRMLENGLDTGDLSSLSDDHAVTIDPLAVQRVDILRGPSTLLYGSSAIGGVVNMIDSSIAEERLLTPLSAELDLRKGNRADDESSFSGAFNGQSAGLSWHFSSFYRDTDSVEIPGFAESRRLREREATSAPEDQADIDEEVRGTLPNSFARSHGVRLGASHVSDDGFMGLSIRRTESLYGIPGSAHEHGHDSEHEEHSVEPELDLGDGVSIDLRQTRVEARGEHRFNDSHLRALRISAAYSDYQHTEFEGAEVGTRFDRSVFETRAELTHRHSDGFEGGAGFQLTYDELRAQGAEAFLPSNNTIAPALFAVEDYRLTERVVVQAGGRVEYVTVDPIDRRQEEFAVGSASLGTVVQLDPTNSYNLGLTTSYSERAPTAAELFAGGPHIASQIFEIGDSALSRERSIGAELVLRKLRGSTLGSLSLFWQHYIDYINLVPTGEERDELPVFAYTQSRARLMGGEALLEQRLVDGPRGALNLATQIDYVRGEDRSRGGDLPRITPLRGRIALTYRHQRTSVQSEAEIVGSQRDTTTFELPTDGFTRINLGASYELLRDARGALELYFRGTNLTNEEVRIHTSFLKDLAPLRGRAFLAGVRVSF